MTQQAWKTWQGERNMTDQEWAELEQFLDDNQKELNEAFGGGDEDADPVPWEKEA